MRTEFLPCPSAFVRFGQSDEGTMTIEAAVIAVVLVGVALMFHGVVTGDWMKEKITGLLQDALNVRL